MTIVAQYAPTYAVWFYNEGVLVHTQWVQEKLDCPDPVAEDYIDTPTKASTDQYSYAFAGWDKSLARVTAPLTVNATYTETVRTYTVYFYNGDALLQTVRNVPYGGSTTYTGTTPSKGEDYEFLGWSPAPVNITGDTYCYSQFRYSGMFSIKFVERTMEGEYENDRVTSIGAHTFYSMPALTSVSFPNVTSVGESAFYTCSKLAAVNFPSLTSVKKNTFYKTVIANLSLPAVTSIAQFGCAENSALTTVDLPVATSLAEQSFYNCKALTTLILRNTAKVCTLSKTNAIGGTLIASGTGYIYVPSALVDSYKAATNWSAYAARIRAIEDYPDITGG